MTPREPSFGSPPTWLPGGRRGDRARAWWRDLGRAVDALRERYPRALADVPADWWRTADLAEQLGAVCAWRLDLDCGRSADPREELDFHEMLDRFHERLGRRARSELLDTGAPPSAAADGENLCALEQALGALSPGPDVSLEAAFFAPNEARPGSAADPQGTGHVSVPSSSDQGAES